jgi:selenocysteine lyase/cysteine desulfurase
LPSKDYQIISSRAPGEKSQIVSLMPKNGETSQEVADYLQSKNIIISPRGVRLRVSPHIFNNFADIDRLVEELP